MPRDQEIDVLAAKKSRTNWERVRCVLRKFIVITLPVWFAIGVVSGVAAEVFPPHEIVDLEAHQRAIGQAPDEPEGDRPPRTLMFMIAGAALLLAVVAGILLA